MLSGFGYSEVKTGRTSGSGVAFWNEERRQIIRLHRPHPQGILKRYQLDQVEEALKDRRLIS